MVGLTNDHRALIQAFHAHRCLKAGEVVPLLHKIRCLGAEAEVPEEQTNERTVQLWIGDVNDELMKFDFEIKAMRDQTDRSTIYALVNQTSDDVIQNATGRTPDEIAFFRRLLDAMFEKNNTLQAEVMAVSTNEALHLSKNPITPENKAASGGLTMRGAEEALDAFEREGWLLKSRNGWYSLAPRAIMELGSYLIQTYNAQDSEESDDSEGPRRDLIKTCHACKELLTVGQRCDTLKCPIRIHSPCVEPFFNRREKRCPTCKEEWTGNSAVGPAAAGKLKKKISKPQAKKGKARNPTAEDEDVEMDDNDDEVGEDEEEEEEE